MPVCSQQRTQRRYQKRQHKRSRAAKDLVGEDVFDLAEIFADRRADGLGRQVGVGVIELRVPVDQLGVQKLDDVERDLLNAKEE